MRARTMFRLAVIVLTLVSITAYAETEKLMKPIAGPGSGQAVNGLRATLSMVKNDFGPGESLMAVWKLSNEGATPVEFTMNRTTWSELTFSARRDGKDLDLARPIYQEGKAKPRTLEPGGAITEFIDLTSIKWTDKSCFKPYGQYEISIGLAGRNVQSGWTKFKIIAAGDPRPQTPPEVAEKLRSLISNLGNNEFAVRENAYNQILNMGMPAMGMLEDTVAAGGDTEIVVRCKRLMEEIRRARFGPPPQPILPQPPPIRPRPVLPPQPPVNPPPPPPQPQKPLPPVDEF